jgi:hypothetical protein
MTTLRKASRKEERRLDGALAIFVLIMMLSWASPLFENIVGVLVTVAIILVGIRMWWELVGKERRADRQLIDEIGPLGGPCPILVVDAEGREMIIKHGSNAWPAARIEQDRQRAATAALARRQAMLARREDTP